MPNRNTSRLGLFVVLALFAGIYGRYVIGYSPSGGDIVNQYLPYQELIRNSVRQGAAPLWNGMTFCGRPLMGDIQVGVLYPPNWLHWLLPLPVSFALLLAAHAAWMMAGCWLLARRWGLHPAAAALGVVLFAGSPFFSLKLSNGVILFIYVGAWWPWLALATARLVERPGAGRMVVLGLALALSLLAGSPQIAYYGWLATLALGLALPSEEKGAARWFGRAALIAGAFVLALTLTAIQTLQTYHFINNSFDRAAGAGWDFITDGSFSPRLLWLLINPGYLGVGHSAAELFWAFPPDFAETCFYLPLWVPAILVPIGLALLFTKSSSTPLYRRLAILSLAAMALGILLAIGRTSPLFALFYKVVPGFGSFRVPARLMLFYSTGIAIVAALAYDRLLTLQPRLASRITVVGLVIGLAAVWGSFALRFRIWEAAGYPFTVGGVVRDPRSHGLIDAHALAMAVRVSAFLLLGAGTLIQARRRPSPPTAFLLPLLAAVELAWLAWPFQTTRLPYQSSVRVADYYNHFYPQTELVKVLQGEYKRTGGRVLWLDDIIDWKLDQNQPELYPNRMVMHGLPEARGYDPVNARWIGIWMNLLAGNHPTDPPRGMMFVERIVRPAWLALMGVSTVISYEDLSNIPGLKPVARIEFPLGEDVLPAFWGGIPGLHEDAQGRRLTTLTVWHNERYRGMAFAAAMPKLVNTADEALAAGAKLAENAAATPDQALVMDQNFLMAKIWPAAGIDERFVVKPLPSTPNAYVYETNYPAPALLCLAESRYGGWTARIGDAPAPISAMDGAFLAIAVPAGVHQVTFEFQPEGLAGGMWISIAALVCVAYLVVREWVVRKKRT